MTPFEIIEPKGEKVPVIISVPHCGTDFPDEIAAHFNSELRKTLDDTDWFVDRLYDFASEMGITIIKARYHRWVIDLNRDPDSKPLYNDGRIITALCTSTDFLGNDIYIDDRKIPNEEEVKRRLELYYWPYYKAIQDQIDGLKMDFRNVLFYDAHSIRKYVSTIRKDPFPDLILGTNDEKSAHAQLIKVALKGLESGPYELTHNFPFKGGHLTRYFGKPEVGQHALQLERAKLKYMDDDEITYSEERAAEMKQMLKPMFTNLIETLSSLD